MVNSETLIKVGAITRHRNEHGIPFRYPTLRHLLQLRPRLPGVPALRLIPRRGNDWTGAGSQELVTPADPLAEALT